VQLAQIRYLLEPQIRCNVGDDQYDVDHEQASAIVAR